MEKELKHPGYCRKCRALGNVYPDGLCELHHCLNRYGEYYPRAEQTHCPNRRQALVLLSINYDGPKGCLD